ncbi:MAG: zwf, partial [Ilumatobacteraceae bacterium]|nr:zwf [Ilumatobacteraceae bacterium]
MAIDGEQQRQNGDDPSVAIVLFGATGDLAARMVLPAVHTMAARGLLPRDWALIGNGRGEMSHGEFRDHVRQALLDAGDLADADEWQVFSDRLFFAGGGFAIDDPGSLPDVLAEVEEVFGRPPDRLVHYLALPPTTFADITSALGTHDLAADAKVVFEKPFGTSLESFETLNDAVHSVLDEAQIYRIDHFLGKEAAQQLHAARFANRLFAEVWSREHVSAVQIDIPEELDIAGRAEFYDETGALSDMIVTHLFQLAAEVAMEPPVSLGAEDLREARETVIAAFRPLDPAEVVLGQFDG